MAFAINSQTGEFTQNDHEILQHLSSACLRKLNRERELDQKGKLIHAYKNLLKIGINLNSRSTIASLIYEAERKLKELLGVQHVIVLIIDKDTEQFMILN